MDEGEYRRLKQQIDEEYARNIEALRRIWRVSHQSPNIPVPPPPDDVGDISPRLRQARGEITKAVHEAVNQTQGPFSWRTIHKLVSELYPGIKPNRTTISQALRKLTDDNILEEISPKRGAIPAQYRRRPADLCTQEQFDELKALVIACDYEIDAFRDKFMKPRGLGKVLESPADQIAEIIEAMLKEWGGTVEQAVQAAAEKAT
jgi:Fe2+ or Zn2+ uptake regulation protein